MDEILRSLASLRDDMLFEFWVDARLASTLKKCAVGAGALGLIREEVAGQE
jgi:hypothetical protein